MGGHVHFVSFTYQLWRFIHDIYLVAVQEQPAVPLLPLTNALLGSWRLLALPVDIRCTKRMQTSAPAPIASSSTLPLPSKKDIASIAPLNRVLPPDWRYEMRREAQEILPNLLIGPYQSSRSLDYMKSLRLTHVLCIQEAREVYVSFLFAFKNLSASS